jgi:hypothetical protein
MTTPLWVHELASEFWQLAGGPEPFPRRLRGPILRAPFDLTFKGFPVLSTGVIEHYLNGLEIPWKGEGAARPLRACLVAWKGTGFIFLDESDAPEEQVFSLAHELAHFLRDYWQPRERAIAALGSAIVEVLDGRRPAHPSERLHALLRAVPIGFHTHLMAREEGMTTEVASVEWQADRLAFELLAPEEEVRARHASRAEASQVMRQLSAEFGLPREMAAVYGAMLFPAARRDPVVERVKIARQARRTSDPGPEHTPGGPVDEP